MLALQQHVRALVNQGLDCAEPSIRLMAMQAEMVDLIRRRDAMGGIEGGPSITERLRQNYRPELRRRCASVKDGSAKDSSIKDSSIKDSSAGNLRAKEKPGRGRALSI